MASNCSRTFGQLPALCHHRRSGAAGITKLTRSGSKSLLSLCGHQLHRHRGRTKDEGEKRSKDRRTRAVARASHLDGEVDVPGRVDQVHVMFLALRAHRFAKVAAKFGPKLSRDRPSLFGRCGQVAAEVILQTSANQAVECLPYYESRSSAYACLIRANILVNSSIGQATLETPRRSYNWVPGFCMQRRFKLLTPALDASSNDEPSDSSYTPLAILLALAALLAREGPVHAIL